MMLLMDRCAIESAMTGGIKTAGRTNSIVNNVAIINIHGAITDGAGVFDWLFGGANIGTIRDSFVEAEGDPEIDLILFDVNSPGGVVSGVSELSDLIFNSEKPTAAYVSGIAASAAYWIISAVDEIYAENTALIGSIGAVTHIEKNSNDIVTFVSSQSPKKWASPESEEGVSEYQQMVDDVADIFIASVARNRGVQKKTVLSRYGEGGVLIAEKAVKAGMIDGIKNLGGIMADNFKKAVDNISLKEQPQAIDPEKVKPPEPSATLSAIDEMRKIAALVDMPEATLLDQIIAGASVEDFKTFCLKYKQTQAQAVDAHVADKQPKTYTFADYMKEKTEGK